MIESHTVPQSLLERFAYNDPHTKSSRLWRYARARPQYNKQSPKSATRYGGHFSDPENAAAEAEIEQRLAREFENPVNHFVHLLSAVSHPEAVAQESAVLIRVTSRRPIQSAIL